MKMKLWEKQGQLVEWEKGLICALYMKVYQGGKKIAAVPINCVPQYGQSECRETHDEHKTQ